MDDHVTNSSANPVADHCSEPTNQTWTSPDGLYSVKTLQEGSGLQFPREGSSCELKIDIVSCTGDTSELKDKIPVTFDEWTTLDLWHSGDLFRNVIIQAVMKMQQMEIAEVTIHFDDSCIITKGGPNIMVLHLELSNFNQCQEIWLLSTDELVKRATMYKAKAADCYKCENFIGAFLLYGFAVKYLILCGPLNKIPDEIKVAHMTMITQCYLNLAVCQSKVSNLEGTVANCTRALEYTPDSVKALYRRGAAYSQLRNYELAQEDLQKASTLEPGNKAVRSLLNTVNKELAIDRNTMASGLKKMFSS